MPRLVFHWTHLKLSVTWPTFMLLETVGLWCGVHAARRWQQHRELVMVAFCGIFFRAENLCYPDVSPSSRCKFRPITSLGRANKTRNLSQCSWDARQHQFNFVRKLSWSWSWSETEGGGRSWRFYGIPWFLVQDSTNSGLCVMHFYRSMLL